MKKLLWVSLIFVWTASMCHAGQVIISFPNGGEELLLGKKVTITWNMIGYPSSVFAKLALYKGGTNQANLVGYIDQNVHISHAPVYEWQVGKYEGGSAGVGNDYYLRFISLDGASDFSDFSNAPFSIVLPRIPVQKLYKWVELNPVPGCPMCGIFDLNGLLAKLGNPVNLVGDLVILRHGRQLGKLGKLGQGGMLLNRAPKLQLAAADFALLGKENQGFEVAIVGARGTILKRQAITLKMK